MQQFVAVSPASQTPLPQTETCWQACPTHWSPLALQFWHVTPFAPQAESEMPLRQEEPEQHPGHTPQSCEQLHLVSLPLQIVSPQVGPTGQSAGQFEEVSLQSHEPFPQ